MTTCPKVNKCLERIKFLALLHARATTVCPGSCDPPEKIFNIFASEMRFTPSINYYDTLGWILFVYRAK